MDIKELDKTLEKFEERLTKIEEYLFEEKTIRSTKEKMIFKGLTGGFRFLINRRFFDEPRSVMEIETELNKKGYHHPYKSVDKTARSFLDRNEFARVRKDDKWAYFLKKIEVKD